MDSRERLQMKGFFHSMNNSEREQDKTHQALKKNQEDTSTVHSYVVMNKGQP